jgi:hypothetical protein
MKFDPLGKEIILACLNKIYFVSNDPTKGINIKVGIWPSNFFAVSLLCIGFIENKVATGSYRGEVLLWEKDRCIVFKSIFSNSPVLGNRKKKKKSPPHKIIPFQKKKLFFIKNNLLIKSESYTFLLN